MHWIAYQTLWALTMEAARQVLTKSCAMTGSVQTFIHIFTYAILIKLIAFIAGTNGLVFMHAAAAFAAAHQIAWFYTTIGGVIAAPVAGAVIICNAFYLEAAHRTIKWISQMTGGTFAEGLMLISMTQCVGSTCCGHAGIAAFIINTGQRCKAVLVFIAFLGFGTTLGIAITHSALWTVAFIRAGYIFTDS